jgi:hypothetical protein
MGLDRCHACPPQRIAGVRICRKDLAGLCDHRANLINEILREKSFAVVLKDHSLDLREQPFEAPKH